MNKEKNLKLNQKIKLTKLQIFERIVFWTIFSVLIGTLAFIIVAICLGSKWNINGTAGKGVWSNVGDLVLTLLGLILLFAPSFLEKKFRVKMPDLLYFLFLVFLFLSIYLGHIRSLYTVLDDYDTFVHYFSGVVLGLGSISLIKFVDKSKHSQIRPWFVLLFAVSFTIMIGVFWEIWEFFRDACSSSSNMQRTINIKTGEPFIGKAAIVDTMKDLIVDTLGALTAGFIGFFAVKKDYSNLDKMSLKIDKNIKICKKKIIKK